MGYMKHNVIAVIGWDENKTENAWVKARAIFAEEEVSPMLEARMNGYWSFFIGPDGSKEGWQDSNEGNERRAMFGDWLDEQRYSDGGSPLHWADIAIDSDSALTFIERDTWSTD